MPMPDHQHRDATLMNIGRVPVGWKRIVTRNQPSVTEILVNAGTIEDAANILGDSPAVVRKHYAKWSGDYQRRTEELFRRVHGEPFWHVCGTRRFTAHKPFRINPLKWCPGWDLNPHSPCGKKDFKSFASADFATRAC